VRALPQTTKAPSTISVPDTIVAVSVHALVGASTGLAAPLGLAGFDKDVILSTQKYLLHNFDSYVRMVRRGASSRIVVPSKVWGREVSSGRQTELRLRLILVL
jgi:hypothetical protein